MCCNYARVKNQTKLNQFNLVLFWLSEFILHDNISNRRNQNSAFSFISVGKYWTWQSAHHQYYSQEKSFTARNQWVIWSPWGSWLMRLLRVTLEISCHYLLISWFLIIYCMGVIKKKRSIDCSNIIPIANSCYGAYTEAIYIYVSNKSVL